MLNYRNIVLLAVAALAYAQAATPQDDVPDDAASLSNECKDILFASGMSKSFKSSPNYTDSYDVELKLSATSADLEDVIKKTKVTPTLKFDTDSDRGFVAKLSYQQVCDLDKESKVAFVATCLNGECTNAPTPIEIPVVPEAKGLDPACARTVSSIILEYAADTIIAGQYIALTKIWVTTEAADAFFAKLPSMKTGDEQGGHYGGKWTPQQLCDVEKSGLVQKVETWAKESATGSETGIPAQKKVVDDNVSYEEMTPEDMMVDEEIFEDRFESTT